MCIELLLKGILLDSMLNCSVRKKASEQVGKKQILFAHSLLAASLTAYQRPQRLHISNNNRLTVVQGDETVVPKLAEDFVGAFPGGTDHTCQVALG
jgi:hypothetical protein